MLIVFYHIEMYNSYGFQCQIVLKPPKSLSHIHKKTRMKDTHTHMILTKLWQRHYYEMNSN